MAFYTRDFEPGSVVANMKALLLSRCILAYDFRQNSYESFQGSEYGMVPQVPSHVVQYTRSGSSINLTDTGRYAQIGADVAPFVRTNEGGMGGLLIEPSSTNIVPRSFEFSAPVWTTTGCTIDRPPSSINLDNNGFGYRLIEDTSTGRHDITNIITIPSTSTGYTVSIHVALDELPTNRLFRISLFGSNSYGTDAYEATIDRTGKLIRVNPASGSITVDPMVTPQDQLPRRWFKITISQEATAWSYNVTSGSKMLCVSLLDHTPSGVKQYTETYTGDGTSAVYLYGVQVEKMNNGTTYIPTSSTTATRSSSKVDINLPGRNFTLVELDILVPQGLTGTSTDRILRFYNGSTEVEYLNWASGSLGLAGLNGFDKPSTFRLGAQGATAPSYSLSATKYMPIKIMVYSCTVNELTVVLVDNFIIRHTHKAMPVFDKISIDGSQLRAAIVVASVKVYEGVYNLKELVTINRINKGEL